MRAVRFTHVTCLAVWILVGAAIDMRGAGDEAAAPMPEWMHRAVEVGTEVFQYATTFEGSKGRSGTSYLWIPPETEHIRGLIYAGDLMMESNFVVDPTIRAACAEQAIAILFSMPQLPLSLRSGDLTGGEPFVKVLDELAAKSNHPELSTVPLMPLGHSAASPTVGLILRWNPDRCFGAITYKGAHPIPAEGPTDMLRGIPNIHIQDYVEEYKDRRETGSLGRMNVMVMRARDPQLLMGIIEDNGSKHPAWCFRLTPLIAEFIRATAALRIGEDGNLKVVPVEAGALVDKDLASPRYPTAPAAEYQGDPKEALWYPSLKMARMMTAYNAFQLAKEAQYIAFVNPDTGEPVSEKDAPPLKFVAPDAFEVAATFLDKAANPVLPQTPVTHGPGPILFAPHGRTLELVGPGRFRLRYHPQAVRWYRISAYEMGDATHRFEELLVDLSLGAQRRGEAQAIDFPRIGSVKQNVFPLALNATSSSGLPVRYVVEYGPAVVQDDKALVLAEMPKRATFPIEIRVTAYQYGSYVEPFIQAADRVSQTIVVE